MSTANGADRQDGGEGSGPEKVHEKLAEKRRALGRGLESLLPGPRVVAAPGSHPSAKCAEGWGARFFDTAAVDLRFQFSVLRDPARRLLLLTGDSRGRASLCEMTVDGRGRPSLHR